ncbi:Ldh family oxidoreductase [uncultured Cardiobacterium sp.]|uniref:Ldh family oxidoreductase n=1 Tax=uncultured Cardiobacterium sp. TaxID=417619 RepID=UPI00262F730E|nr:Ldh family oxidoreductase [uncultured Cardiobacterium sp.]
MTDTYLSYDQLHALLTGVLQAGGYNAAHAAAIAHTMTQAERDQCRSHGIYRLAGVLKSRRAGLATGEKAPVIADAADKPITKIDAGGEFAPLASAQGLPLLAAKARRYGLAALAINHCLHLAALWPEVEALTHQGLGALAMCPSNAYVAPAGGIRKLFGTNPLAFGWPTGDDRPYVFDFATSVIARGEVELYRLDNKPLPDGWGIDRDGQPSNDAAAVLDGGALLPFGGYKGSAIATMIELLAAVWIGDLLSSESSEADGGRGLAPLHGELIIALDPTAFGAADYEAHSRALLDAIRDQGARLPSQRRYAARAAAATQGIPISADNLAKLRRMEKGELDVELY